ncbi:hypothetical protein HYT56_03545 [Candidatus Woesearchaeota archaeon]|nr:hypothetical protein [Candidatus Woesearchaeota archaeon]
MYIRMMKKKLILFGILLTVFLVSGQGCQVDEKLAKEIASENIDKLVVCESPYIRFGTGCCLDQNNNKVCDNDEQQNPEPAKIEEPVQAVPEFERPFKPAPQLSRLWIGSRTGLEAANPLQSNSGDNIYFYLWFENSGETAINCETKEFYDGAINDEWTQTILKQSKDSMRILIEPDPTKSYRTIWYEATCYNLGEKGLQDIQKETQINIDYK